MLYLSYVPLLTDYKGMIRPTNQKAEIIQMLTEASESYRIQAVAWAALEEKTYPVFVVPHGVDICRHIKQWSQQRPENYFTLVWRKQGKGYDIALLPDFEKSARRYHQLTRDQSSLTILGHLFLYQVAESEFDIEALRGRSTIRLGWSSGLDVSGNVADYEEIKVRCRSVHELSIEDRTHIEKYWVLH